MARDGLPRQRELLQHNTHTNDLLVATAAAPAAAAPAMEPHAAAAGQGLQMQEEVERFVEGLVATSQQLLLWKPW
jgi:hypothetical protein